MYEDYGLPISKEMALKFLQGRGIRIPSLDLEGIQAWAKSCQDSGNPPAATFMWDAYTGDITYYSGSGDTKIIIYASDYRRTSQAELYSIEEDLHVDKLSFEFSRLFEDPDMDIDYALVGREDDPERIIVEGYALMRLDYIYK